MIHANSTLSNHQIKFKKHGRHARILQVFHITGRPMTDREIKKFLHFEEMNSVRPRVTELIEAGRLKECGDVIDSETRKRVRLTRLVKPEENIQPELF